MNRQPHAAEREMIVAKAMEEVASELRLIELADYVAFIRLESIASIADIVESAAELYFQPGTLRLGHGCEAHVSWTEPPRIVLDLELRPQGATVYFKLTLNASQAGVEVNYIAFEAPSDSPGANSAFLAQALEASRIQRTRQPCG
ncbi:hypothetical protein [Chelativorans sp. AA-79]|uniref:hypothetical protein n=1 Tax=Chelativorans sp. AA-79 TaxID=3028735 RepID=UPI0023F77977|nr:hypothetical protein [Chelativorans sp. AA-79]WEX08295.1 hypothetical protein PVE73_19770 [Chelativorans sp. AA-79]